MIIGSFRYSSTKDGWILIIWDYVLFVFGTSLVHTSVWGCLFFFFFKLGLNARKSLLVVALVMIFPFTFFWGLITMDFCTFLSNYTGTYTVKDFRHDVHRWVNPTGRIWRFSGQSLRRCFVFWHKKKAIVRIGCVRINQSWWLYPLVNCYITMERSTIFNGYIHYFD